MADGDLFEGGAGERWFAGEAFEEHAGKGVDVGAGLDVTGPEPLGGHVGPGADGRAFGGQLRIVRGAGDAEVDEVGKIVVRQQNVGGFDVTVHEAGLVGGVEC